ncbi:sulfite exporter TauE/SafE family protein [Candidatus Protofrankia californiensis]|uniref:sulfite exporter TauE/SafE family protein n=1 Tax=Candidatus Protofrankia californiensis TaxID=1839754 RepID=UPI0019D1CE48|nr:sulfite exporter TauE/SafE family protein [Candidatus Protofrankia californiensis]
MSTITDLTWSAWTLLLISATMVGFAKTAISGAASLAVVLFALALPAKESTATLLPLLICGDVVALCYYRSHADWALLARLFPGVIPGVLLGAGFLAVVDDTTMRLTLAILVLLVVVVPYLLRGKNVPMPGGLSALQPRSSSSHHSLIAVLSGCLAGFTTMTANTGGPVMTSYLISRGLSPQRMLGTTTWFFVVLNLGKLPISTGLGLLRAPAVLLDLLLVPAMLAGGVIGALVIHQIDQRTFERVAIGFAALSALLLLA